MTELSELPLAQVRPARRWSWWWLLPLLALAGAIWLTWSALSQRGTLIVVEFDDGHGIKAGDLLRYRGIEAGRVQQARFSADLGKIQVELRLHPSAVDLARAGSRYWIARPQLDWSGASGLETIVGANYLSVLPGDGAKQTRFTGLETPPLRDLVETGGLEIVLSSHSQGALQRGAAVSYRQAHIGVILSVELAADANAVEVRAYIKPAYAHLIRERVRFWKSGGARLDAGWLSGLSLRVDSMQAFLAGGISLAVPPQAGKPVEAGFRFALDIFPSIQRIISRVNITQGISWKDGMRCMPNPSKNVWRSSTCNGNRIRSVCLCYKRNAVNAGNGKK
jgi:paraquat-inducible protein B